MEVREVLRLLDLGNSVAEHDTALQNYFVETETFRQLIEDKADVVAGDKGTGKTALFQILQKRYTEFEELSDVEILAGFNVAGAPVFQRLLEAETLDEGRYISVWKAYLLSLVGNWILQLYEDDFTEKMDELSTLLTSVGLRSKDDTPNTVFSRLVNLLKKLASVELTAGFTQDGIPVVGAKLEISDHATGMAEQVDHVPHEHALALLDDVLEEVGVSIWVVLDRLDEAFQGFPDVETPALRALLRTYLDLAAFPHLRVKLFVRKDLFRRIIGDGFVNLTHINARKFEINWSPEDLYDLLYRRIIENKAFIEAIDVDEADRDAVFGRLFPDQVDPGTRKPKTWTWILGRIRDGNDVLAPRNLIDLTKKAQTVQLKREDRDPRPLDDASPQILPESLKLALEMLSSERVEDTLLAEAGDIASLLEKFRGGKAEHSMASLAQLLDLTNAALKDSVQSLKDVGFLEPVGGNFKIPILYRDGLSITQGKAF